VGHGLPIGARRHQGGIGLPLEGDYEEWPALPDAGVDEKGRQRSATGQDA
jgi:hypothetical protein